MGWLLSVGLMLALVAAFFSWLNTRSKIKKLSLAKISKLQRTSKNPILSPESSNHFEANGVFNPAALRDQNGKTHLLYRAIGNDGVSRLGYAASTDGENFTDKFPFPVFGMSSPRLDALSRAGVSNFNPVMYPSGGSCGGVEDPRMVAIDGKIYVTFNGFDGWDFIRVGVISIKESDLEKKRWRWSKSIFISPPGEINKNWVLFPEKIKGKFAILHSITPKIQIDFVDQLEDLATGKKKIKSVFKQNKNHKGWDSNLRGAGPPPLKTKDGWLVLYHAMDKKEPHRYKLGALLLDLKNPKKEIGRANFPILAPDEWYENDGKPGVVYACGATLDKQNILRVYYGGGDKRVCVASMPLASLLKSLAR
ncbi:MAG: hypothetical protein WC673_00280 [Candidatus Paceibacterota bacterium]|jgi:predicted GH43/DUF377 family glycosyl hydrolase